jgi:recombination protein RecR
MYPPSIQKLIEIFSKFPGVGKRTAARFVFFILENKEKIVEELKATLLELKEKIKYCQFCQRAFEGKNDLCEICSDKGRDKNTICVVEKDSDLEAIEKTKIYKGKYFVLGGTLSGFKDKEKKLRIKELKLLLKSYPEIEEVIIALNFTPEGQITALYLEKILKKFPHLKITRISKGLPSGGELEYADEETLSFAILKRN